MQDKDFCKSMDEVQECLEKCEETSYKVAIQLVKDEVDYSWEYINDLQSQVDEDVTYTCDLELTMMCQVHCSHCPEGDCNELENS